MQNKRIVPRASTFYTFYDEKNQYYTLVPVSVRKNGLIIFRNVTSKTFLDLSIKEFEFLYKHKLVSEHEQERNYREELKIFSGEHVFAVAKGRIDNLLTDKPYVYSYATKNYPGKIAKHFNTYHDAVEFLNKYNFSNDIGEPLLIQDMSEKEKRLFQLFSCLSEVSQDLLIDDAESYLQEEQIEKKRKRTIQEELEEEIF